MSLYTVDTIAAAAATATEEYDISAIEDLVADRNISAIEYLLQNTSTELLTFESLEGAIYDTMNPRDESPDILALFLSVLPESKTDCLIGCAAEEDSVACFETILRARVQQSEWISWLQTATQNGAFKIAAFLLRNSPREVDDTVLSTFLLCVSNQELDMVTVFLRNVPYLNYITPETHARCMEIDPIAEYAVYRAFWRFIRALTERFEDCKELLNQELLL